MCYFFLFFFFFNDSATTVIYTLSLHDALPICLTITENVISKPNTRRKILETGVDSIRGNAGITREIHARDRKSTRLNSSHGYISYAVFCLKKKKKKQKKIFQTKDKNKIIIINR